MPERRLEPEASQNSERKLSAPSCVQCGLVLGAQRSVSEPTPPPLGACPGCGCDFRHREPMSYARMEGFLEIDPLPEHDFDRAAYQTSWNDALETRLIERWLLTIFLGLVSGLVVLRLMLG